MAVISWEFACISHDTARPRKAGTCTTASPDPPWHRAWQVVRDPSSVYWWMNEWRHEYHQNTAFLGRSLLPSLLPQPPWGSLCPPQEFAALVQREGKNPSLCGRPHFPVVLEFLHKDKFGRNALSTPTPSKCTRPNSWGCNWEFWDGWAGEALVATVHLRDQVCLFRELGRRSVWESGRYRTPISGPAATIVLTTSQAGTGRDSRSPWFASSRLTNGCGRSKLGDS